MKSFFKESSLFRKNFRLYMGSLSVVWLIVLIGIGGYQINTQVMKDKRGYEEQAKKLTLLLDNQLEVIHIVYNNLLNASWMNKMMANTHLFDEELDYLRKKEISQELVNWLTMNDLLDHVGVIFPYKDVVLSSTGVFNKEAYAYFLNKQYKLTSQEWEAYLDAPWEEQIFREGFQWQDNKSLILFRALEMSHEPKSILLVTLSKGALEQLITQLCDEKVNAVKIYNKANECWLELEYHQKQGGYEIQIPSQVMGICYELSYDLNKQEILSSVIGQLLGIGILGLGGVVLVAYGLAFIQYKPLKGLIEKVKKYNIEMEQEEFSVIEKTLDQLVKENSKMKEKVERYYDLAQNTLYTQLLKGMFDLEVRRGELEQLGMIHYEKQKHCVILIDRQTTQLTNEEFIKLTLLIEEKLKAAAYVYQLITQLEHVVVICSFEQQDQREQAIQCVKNEIHQYLGYHLRMSYSLLHEGIIGISKAYQEALAAMSHIRFSQDTFQILFDHYDLEMYYYPTDWEVQLIKNLKQGNLEVVGHILDEIYQENTSRQLVDIQKQRLTNRIMETLIRVLYELKLEEEIFRQKFEAIYQHQTIDEIWEYIYQTTQMIGEKVKATLQEENFNIHEALLTYVKTHYMQSDLSLKLMSEEFKLSVASISRLFKNAAGVNFHEYLTTLRMEKAKEMIQQEGYAVKKIAKAIGYESEYTFKRAFERNEGVKVKEYYLELNKEIREK